VENIKSMLKTMVTDSIEINHYLEEVMYETTDSFEIVLLVEQIRKNNETMLEMISIYLETQEPIDDIFTTTIELLNLRKRE